MMLDKWYFELVKYFDKDGSLGLFVNVHDNVKIIKELEKEEKWFEIKKFFDAVKKKTGKPLPNYVEEFFSNVNKTDKFQILQRATTETNEINEGLIAVLTKKIENYPEDKLVIKVDFPLNIEQVKEVISRIYKDTGKIVFPIPKTKEIIGRIVAKNTQHYEQVELVRVYEYIKDDEEVVEFKLFGEKVKHKRPAVNRLYDEYYEYTFVTDDNQRFIMYSKDNLPIGKYKIYGLPFVIEDLKKLGEDAKKNVLLNVLFVNSIEPYIHDLSPEEIAELREKWDTHDKLAEVLLGKHRHPKWFEKLLFTILFVNEEYEYPNHLLMIGDIGTGKSRLVHSIGKVFGQEVLSTKATYKGLLPSYKERIPQIGYLCEAERVALVDEFLHFIPKTTSNEQSGEAFSMFTDLLEHYESVASSGNTTEFIIKMTSRLIAVANPLKEMQLGDIKILLDKVNKAFLSRMLIYFQTPQHVKFITDNSALVMSVGREAYPEPNYDFVNLCDYLSKQKVELDLNKVKEIYEEIFNYVPSAFVDIYTARYMHHLMNMIAGIHKYRWFFGETEELNKADEKDYEEAKELMLNIVSSWTLDDESILLLPEKMRLNVIGVNERIVYEAINSARKIKVNELDDTLKAMTKVSNIRQAVNNLYKFKLIYKYVINGEEYIVPYWYGTASQNSESVESDSEK